MIQKDFEQVYGAFWFRPQDAKRVGGFPTYLSPLGFRGEMMTQTAIHFLGKKLRLEPSMWSWHYSASFGGLRLVQGSVRDASLKHDSLLWEKFLERGTATIARPEGV
jgi:hypothetical protein